MEKKWQINRRKFLRGLGTTIALPVLEAMMPVKALAQAGSRPMRTAFMYWPNGMPFPGNNASNYANPYQGIATSLSAYRNDYTLLHGIYSRARDLHGATGRGFDMDGHGDGNVTHMSAGVPTLLGNRNLGVQTTVDQVLATELFRNSRFPSIGVNVQPEGGGNVDIQHAPIYGQTIFWKGPNSPVKLYNNPRELFNLMFGSTNPIQNNQQQDMRLAKKKLILDFVMEDIQSMRTQLGARDRQRFEEYLTSLEEVEKNIVAVEDQNAGQCTIPTAPGTINLDNMGTYVQRYDLLQDLMVKAFECDLTRVFQFMVGHETMTCPYVQGLNDNADWHHYSHDDYAGLTRILDWHYRRFGSLITKLKAKTDIDGNSIFSNSLLVFTTGMGNGLSHYNANNHVILAGSLAGKYRMGQNLNYNNNADIGDVWLTILQDMGVNRTSYNEGKKIVAGLRV